MSSDDSWVFDSLLCFLHGPIWNAPLQTFIEEKSIVFDPNSQLDENDTEIKEIHVEYKKLVDYMLGTFMEEMQIQPEQFEQACMEGRNQKEHLFQYHQALFQQIWAANDIKIFIRMMTQRNVELQLQALDLIEKGQLALLKDGSNENNASDSEGINYTHGEHEVADSVGSELRNTAAAASVDDDAADRADSDIANKFERLNLFFEKDETVNPNDILSRQEYLRQQRDKIVEIKRKTRVKQLMDTVARTGESGANGGTVGKGRPTSAQAAQKIITNDPDTEQLLDAEHGNTAIQLRMALAKRLRSEVVEQK